MIEGGRKLLQKLRETMDHWNRVLPNKILRVNNEDVIEDLEGQVRRMLEFLELPFEETVSHFMKQKGLLELLAQNK